MKRVAIYIRFPFDSDGGLNIEQNLKDFASVKEDWEVKEVFLEKNCSLKRTEKHLFHVLTAVTAILI